MERNISLFTERVYYPRQRFRKQKYHFFLTHFSFLYCTGIIIICALTSRTIIYVRFSAYIRLCIDLFIRCSLSLLFPSILSFSLLHQNLSIVYAPLWEWEINDGEGNETNTLSSVAAERLEAQSLSSTSSRAPRVPESDNESDYFAPIISPSGRLQQLAHALPRDTQ